MLLQMAKFHSFLWLSSIPLCVCLCVCIYIYYIFNHSIVNGHLDCFPCGSDVKEFTCNVGDQGLIPELERSPGGGHGNPLQYSCLENPMDRAAWWASVCGVIKSQTQISN